MYILEEFEEFDKYKTKVLKYILYKKRTKYEVKQKFEKDIPEDLLEEIIENLEENGYISDISYIERSVDEFMLLKTLSIKEIKYKLISKGIKSSIIEDYIQNNKEDLEQYEVKSAIKIVCKKQKNMDEMEIKNFLIKKGYSQESIYIALNERN